MGSDEQVGTISSAVTMSPIVIGPMVQKRSISGKFTDSIAHVKAIQLSAMSAVKLDVLMSVSVSSIICDDHGLNLEVEND